MSASFCAAYVIQIVTQQTLRAVSVLRLPLALVAATVLVACSGSPGNQPPAEPERRAAQPSGVAADKNVKLLCKESPRDTITKIKAALEVIDTNIPNIPPEERKFIERENNAMVSSATHDQQAMVKHMTALESRPLYAAWEVRVQLEYAQSKVDEVFKEAGMAVFFYDRENANVLHRMMTLATFVASVDSAVNKYLGHVADELVPELTRPQLISVTQASAGLGFDIERAMQCQLASVLAAIR
jgi:hypothetical protein